MMVLQQVDLWLCPPAVDVCGCPVEGRPELPALHDSSPCEMTFANRPGKETSHGLTSRMDDALKYPLLPHWCFFWTPTVLFSSGEAVLIGLMQCKQFCATFFDCLTASIWEVIFLGKCIMSGNVLCMFYVLFCKHVKTKSKYFLFYFLRYAWHASYLWIPPNVEVSLDPPHPQVDLGCWGWPLGPG